MLLKGQRVNDAPAIFTKRDEHACVIPQPGVLLLFPMSRPSVHGASAFLKNVCGQFLFASAFCILSERAGRLSRSFSHHPTSSQNFSIHLQKRNNYSYLPESCLSSLPPYLPHPAPPARLPRRILEYVEWVSEEDTRESAVAPDFSPQFRPSPPRRTDASIKLRQYPS